VAYSCKGRGVCPSCNTRRMVETAAHLCDHVFPRLPVRQWVLSEPKRLRYFMQRDGAVLNMVLRIFLRVIAQSLQSNCPGAAQVNRAALHIGAVAFIHRFGSSLNGHVHFHVCASMGCLRKWSSSTGLPWSSHWWPTAYSPIRLLSFPAHPPR
jgi:Putative transposase/Transposase zinc-binding domain